MTTGSIHWQSVRAEQAMRPPKLQSGKTRIGLQAGGLWLAVRSAIYCRSATQPEWHPEPAVDVALSQVRNPVDGAVEKTDVADADGAGGWNGKLQVSQGEPFADSLSSDQKV